MIEVTAAIIYQSNQVLLCQRAIGTHCELLWEFPGGKVKSVETYQECLILECQEELGIIIQPEIHLCDVSYKYPEFVVNLHFYISKVVKGTPSCNEHQAIKWCSLNEVLTMPLCPADKNMFNKNVSKIQEALSMSSL